MCCTGKAVGTIDVESKEEVFLGTVHASADAVSSTGSPWVVDLKLNGCLVQFKIYTGADIMVIGESDYDQGRDGPLQSCGTTLSGPSQNQLVVVGKFQANMRCDDRVK